MTASDSLSPLRFHYFPISVCFVSVILNSHHLYLLPSISQVLQLAIIFLSISVSLQLLFWYFCLYLPRVPAICQVLQKYYYLFLSLCFLSVIILVFQFSFRHLPLLPSVCLIWVIFLVCRFSFPPSPPPAVCLSSSAVGHDAPHDCFHAPFPTLAWGASTLLPLISKPRQHEFHASLHLAPTLPQHIWWEQH